MNRQIIDIFQKLIKKIEHDYLMATMEKSFRDANVHRFRLTRIVHALDQIKHVKYKITSGDQVASLPGVGKGTVARINEILETGMLAELQLPNKDDMTSAVRDIEQVIGIGDKTAAKLVRDYKINSAYELKKKVASGEIYVNDKIKMGLKYYGVVQVNIPRKEIVLIEKMLINEANKIDPELKLIICGSFRRGTTTSGDIDVLIYHPMVFTKNHVLYPKKYNLKPYLIDFVDHLTKKGNLLDHLTGKNYIREYMGFFRYKTRPVRRMDIKFIPHNHLAPAMLYFTGPQALNIAMRDTAKSKDMKLNRYGLYKIVDDAEIPIKVRSEEDIFKKLGMKYMTPIERERYQ
jgi:DNA polymerase/3'-5' exonuclease PolX